MKTMKRSIMLALTVALVALFMCAAAVAVSADSLVDDDYLVIDMTQPSSGVNAYKNYLFPQWQSAAAADWGGSHNPYPYPDSDLKVFNLFYTANDYADTHLKVAFRMTDKNNATEKALNYNLTVDGRDLIIGKTYMVVTYRTNLTGKKLQLINGTGANGGTGGTDVITLAENVGASNGEFVRTKPININGSVTTGTSHYARLLNGEFNTLYVTGIDSTNFSGVTTSGTDYFNIKEIAFFTSPEAAYDYYGNEPEPFIINMSSWENSKDYLNTKNYSRNEADWWGCYNYFLENPDDPNSKAFLLFHTNNNYANTHLKVAFQLQKYGLNSIIENKYMVVTYKTNLYDKKLEFVNGNGEEGGTDVITLAENVGVSNGEYVRTMPININKLTTENDHHTRLCAGKFNTLYVTGIKSDADYKDLVDYFYIKEIAFFATPAQAYEYYGIDLDPVVIDMSSEEAAEEYLNVYAPAEDKISGNYKFDSKEDALSLLYNNDRDNYASSHLKFTVQMKNRDMIYGNRYMVVTYKTNLTGKALKFNNFLGVDDPNYIIELAADVGESEGKYVRTEPININVLDTDADHYTRLLEGKTTLLYVTGINNADELEGKYFYIKEIAFFESAKEAAIYYSNDNEKLSLNSGMVMMMLLKAKAQAKENANKPVDAFVIDLTNRMAAKEIITVKTEDSWDFGKYEFGEEGVNVGYSTQAGSNEEYNKLHVKFRVNFKNANMLPESKKFMVVTYKTNIDTKTSLKFNNMWAFSQLNYTLTLAENVASSKGEWKRTSPINIDSGVVANSNHFLRFNHPQLGNLFYLDGDISEAYYADKYFTIKEIAFFDSEKDAKAYYNGK